MIRFLILLNTIIFSSFAFLYSQTYLIKELKGGIWVTSQVEITNQQQTAKEDKAEPEPITINNSVITSEEMERMGYRNAKEAIANQPGFIDSGSYMGNETISTPGGNADNVKIYLNGVLLNTAKGNADAGVDLRRIPANLIEKIEIRGSSIYITTKAPANDILLVSLGYGAYNTFTPSILFSRNIDKNQTFTFTADTFYSRANYHYDFTDVAGDRIKGNMSNNNQFIANGSMEYKYKFDDSKDYINAFVNISYSDAVSKYKLPPYDATDSWFKFTTIVTGLSYNGFSDILDYKVTASYLYDSFQDRQYFQGGRPESDYQSHAVALSADLSRFDVLLPDTITLYNKIIPEYRYDTLIESDEGLLENFEFAPQRHTFSLFYEPQLSFGYWDNNSPIFTIMPNIKYEFNHEKFQNTRNNHYLAYKGAFNLNFYKNYSLYFSYSYDYTVPNFNDLFYGPYGNTNLRPEGYDEVYVKLAFEPITNLKLENSYAYTTYKDKIIWIGVPVNVDTAVTHVFNSSISYEIPFAKEHKIISKIGYTYNMAYMTEYKYKKVGLPEHIIRTFLGYDFLPNNKVLSSLSININYNYSVPRPIVSNAPIFSDEFHDLNISLYSIWFDHLIFGMHFKNILNKTPILSTYSVARPFTWEFDIGYNF